MQNLESWVNAEHAVLGALLLKPSCGLELDIGPEHFISDDLRQVFETIQSLQASAEPIDTLTVAARLEKSTGKPWLAHIGQIARECAGYGNVKAYAGLLLESHRKLKARAIAESLLEGDGDQDSIDQAVRGMMALSMSRRTFEYSVRQAVQEGNQLADDALHGITGAPTGLYELDSKLGGLHRDDLIVVGARPGYGKTAFMLNLAIKGGVAAGIISGEQPMAQIGMRVAGLQAHVPVHTMRIGTTSDEEFKKLGKAACLPINDLLRINDKSDITVGEIQRQARQWAFERNIKALYVDYLQRLKHHNSKMQRREQIGDIIRGLKDLARELHIPVILLAQLNRDAAKRGGHPQVYDLAESGEIEREADQILLLHRDNEQAKTLDVFVAKNRHGPMGRIELAWVPEYMAVENIERRY